MTSQRPKYCVEYCYCQYYCQFWDYWYWYWFWITIYSILILVLILPSHFCEYWYWYWYCIATFLAIDIECLPKSVVFNINSIDIDIGKQYRKQSWYCRLFFWTPFWKPPATKISGNVHFRRFSELFSTLYLVTSKFFWVC